MRTCRRAVTILTLSLMPLAVWAAVPVVDDNSGYNNSGGSYPSAGYGASGAYAGGGVSAPVSAQGELFNQLQQMQDQIARQQGVIEVLQNDISRMKQESLERYQDLDRRIGAGVAPAATPDNSSAGGCIPPPVIRPRLHLRPPASSEPGDPAKEKLYYDAAFDLIKAKDFDKASQAFTAFPAQIPKQPVRGQRPVLVG
jgi:TolA-binding protein